MSTDGLAPTPEGWYRDPSGGAIERYFDGSGWTLETRPVELRRRRPADEFATPSSAPQPAGPAVPDRPLVAPAVLLTSPPSGSAVAPGGQGATFGALPATPLPTSPFRTTSRGSGLTSRTSSRPRSVPRRSLTDALGSPVSSRSSQQLLLGTATALPPRSMRTASAPTPVGWYPDPARGGGLRFFDGAQWTSRTRPSSNDVVRHLPTAALKLRSRVLEAQDAAAVRRGPRVRRQVRLVIPRAASAPSLRVRSRSGSMWGMLSTLLMVVGLAAAGLFAWQLWGTDYENTFQQKHLEEVLNAQPKTGWGDVPVVVGTGPAPTAGAAPDVAASPSNGSAALPGTRPGTRPGTPAPGAHTSSHTAGPGSSGPAPGPTPRPTPGAGSSPASTTQVHIAPNAHADGRPVGHISIPAIGVKRVFVLGTDEAQLALGPGLWKWGAFPGTPGNTTIAGHRTTHGAPFYRLNELSYGDRIYIDVPGQPQAVYEVRGKTIASPFDVRITQQTAGVRLTLSTCNPVGSVRERLVIQSELISGRYVDDALPRSKWRLLH